MLTWIEVYKSKSNCVNDECKNEWLKAAKIHRDR